MVYRIGQTVPVAPLTLTTGNKMDRLKTFFLKHEKLFVIVNFILMMTFAPFLISAKSTVLAIIGAMYAIFTVMWLIEILIPNSHKIDNSKKNEE